VALPIASPRTMQSLEPYFDALIRSKVKGKTKRNQASFGLIAATDNQLICVPNRHPNYLINKAAESS